MQPIEAIRRFWDDDAATYDRSEGHHPRSAAERAAWAAALARLLPPAPARVLDVGSGTGFLALGAARLGHLVTAVDLSPAMLGRLRAKARDAGLQIEAILAQADVPPPGPFDAVIERHLVWTLPEPVLTLKAWREACPDGRLVLFESVWGVSSGFADRVRQQVRKQVDSLRRRPPDHHGEYDASLRAALPLGDGTPPGSLIELVEAAGWPRARLERLRDVEWATSLALPAVERLTGVPPRFVVIAG